MKRLALILALPALLTLAGPGRAGLINGDFQAGDFTGWTRFTTANGTLGHPPVPDVVPFDTTGLGGSLAARFQVGRVVIQPGNAGGGIFQGVMLNAGTLAIDLDVAAHDASGFGNGGAGIFELLLDGAVVDSVNFVSILPSATERASLHHSTTVLAGLHEIRVRITRPFTIAGGFGVTPFQFIDNVELSGTSLGTAALPAPGGLVLVAAGALTMGGWCGLRRRRVQQGRPGPSYP